MALVSRPRERAVVLATASAPTGRTSRWNLRVRTKLTRRFHSAASWAATSQPLVDHVGPFKSSFSPVANGPRVDVLQPAVGWRLLCQARR